MITSTAAPPSILGEIVAHIRKGLPLAQRREPLDVLQAKVAALPKPVDFAAALRQSTIQIIAEVKKASPSAGVLKPRMNPVSLAGQYTAGGAAAISVLTESKYFQGSLHSLDRIRESLDEFGVADKHKRRPALLRKDFIVDPYQVYQARAYGADALLLIVAVLTDAELRSLLSLTRSLGMEALVEVHDETEAERALASDARVIGINNRDLRTFKVDMGTTRRIRPILGKDRIVVSESGIKGRADIEQLEAWDVDAVLIGETLVIDKSPKAKLQELLGKR